MIRIKIIDGFPCIEFPIIIQLEIGLELIDKKYDSLESLKDINNLSDSIFKQDKKSN